jgi:hypothetical protein
VLVALLMLQFCSLVNSDMTGGNSEFAFWKFCGVIWTVRSGIGGCVASVCVLDFLSEFTIVLHMACLNCVDVSAIRICVVAGGANWKLGSNIGSKIK